MTYEIYLVLPPCSKQAQLYETVQEIIQTDFVYSQGWRLHNVIAQPVPVYDHSQSKIFFSDN